MTQNEAKNLIMLKYPDHIIDKVTEMDKYFLVSISTNKGLGLDIVRPIACDDGLKAVDKITKQIFTYNPIKHGVKD